MSSPTASCNGWDEDALKYFQQKWKEAAEESQRIADQIDSAIKDVVEDKCADKTKQKVAHDLVNQALAKEAAGEGCEAVLNRALTSSFKAKCAGILARLGIKCIPLVGQAIDLAGMDNVCANAEIQKPSPTCEDRQKSLYDVQLNLETYKAHQKGVFAELRQIQVDLDILGPLVHGPNSSIAETNRPRYEKLTEKKAELLEKSNKLDESVKNIEDKLSRAKQDLKECLLEPETGICAYTDNAQGQTAQELCNQNMDEVCGCAKHVGCQEIDGCMQPRDCGCPHPNPSSAGMYG